MSFTSGQVLTAAQLNDLDIDSLTLTDATPVLTLKDTNSTGTSNFAIKFTDSADTDLARIYGGGGNDILVGGGGYDVYYVARDGGDNFIFDGSTAVGGYSNGLVLFEGFENGQNSASAVIDFPQPDSPNNASVSPFIN